MSTSVLCANYNNGQFLDDFFKSLIDSTVVPDEVVFVDDGSSDNSLEIVERYKPFLNIILIGLEFNIGFANALNIGLAACSADYIVRVDPDDLVSPRRLEMQLMEFAKSKVDVVGSQARYFYSESGKPINDTNMPIGAGAIKNAYYAGDNGVLHGTVMVRSVIFKRYSYRQEFVPSEDYDIFSRMMLDGVSFVNIDIPLTFVRIHSRSVSNSIKFKTIEKVYKIRREVFNINYTQISAFIYFSHVFFYRRFLFSTAAPSRLFYGVLASFMHPKKALRRIHRWLDRTSR